MTFDRDNDSKNLKEGHILQNFILNGRRLNENQIFNWYLLFIDVVFPV